MLRPETDLEKIRAQKYWALFFLELCTTEKEEVKLADIIKRGRPKIGNGKVKRLSIRVSERDMEMIEFLANLFSKSKTDVVLDAVRAKYVSERFGK